MENTKQEQTVSHCELEEIRRFARKELGADEIYTFPIILCDNEVDRDTEKFTSESLARLAELFVGKTGIFDHRMSSKDQTARIYRAEVLTDESRTTADGEKYTYVKAMAYMLRNEKNKDLIEEIEAGIKKETSVSCSVKSIRCSVCGKDIKSEGCGHIKGASYGGKTCFYLLCEPEDAYEWSFVAVPAQKNAGVTKSYGGSDANREIAREIRNELKNETLAAAISLIPEMDQSLMEEICLSLSLKGLRKLRDTLIRKHGSVSPVVSQLQPRAQSSGGGNNDEYRI
ncbi:MAG: hypothetical protein IJM02_06955 [Clostridia bacterium]|nr:hypothetical protein [Clostridia bacterium]